MFKNINFKTILLAILIILLISIAFVSANRDLENQPITEIEWRWVELVESLPASQSLVPNPENYILVLSADGELNIKADCNGVGGSYIADENSITINLGPSTMMYCGDDSLDNLYLSSLSLVESYTIDGEQLVLHFANQAGYMTFSK